MMRDVFNRADDVLGWQLSGIMFEGPDEELRQTRNAQPAIFLYSYALYQLLKQPGASMAAGHSLGEYTALTVANALTFDDALNLVKIRAEAMQEAGTAQPGTMAAIVGMEDAQVVTLCEAVSAEIGVVQAANFNSPGQVVVSGSPEAVAEAMRRAKEAGARMAKQLNVSGAFHSPLMASARRKLAEGLEKTRIANADFPVYVNVSAEPTTDAGAIRASLLEQLTAPVRWTETVLRMQRDGATGFVEVGPGNVLQGLVKRIAPDAVISGIADLATAEHFNTTNA
jgi:[acyl-carrier-protein] S-malonyltransferase